MTEHDLTKAGQFVDSAIRAAVPAAGLVKRSVRPESMFTWDEPTPQAGLRAALAVARIAESRAHRFAVALRGEGLSWVHIADLFKVPYSDDYSRRERVFEMVTDPPSGAFDRRRVFWKCGGPQGCGEHIADSGPYEPHPSDNESGHATSCGRAAAEIVKYERESAERDRRDQVRNEAFAKLTDPFDRETVNRCWWTIRHGGEINGALSTTQKLAVAVVLRDNDYLKAVSYTRAEAIRHAYNATPDQVRRRLALLRAAATGERGSA